MASESERTRPNLSAPAMGSRASLERAVHVGGYWHCLPNGFRAARLARSVGCANGGKDYDARRRRRSAGRVFKDARILVEFGRSNAVAQSPERSRRPETAAARVSERRGSGSVGGGRREGGASLGRDRGAGDPVRSEPTCVRVSAGGLRPILRQRGDSSREPPARGCA